MDQLTIFEVINEFDDSKCNWVDVLGAFETCTVLAMIPAEGFSPLENPYKYGSEEHQKAHKIWREYAYAIFSHIGPSEKSWEVACNRFKSHRDSNEPCLMQIYRTKRSDDFRPSEVMEYI